MISWVKKWNAEEINEWCRATIHDSLGIAITEVGANYIVAKMPVDHRTQQPVGLLHGGASAVLAESLASIASNLLLSNGARAMGIELNISHLKAVRSGHVTGTCYPIRIGQTLHVWRVSLRNESGELTAEARVTIFCSKEKS